MDASSQALAGGLGLAVNSNAALEKKENTDTALTEQKRKLTQRMLNGLIDHIEIHQSEKIDGVHAQKLTIHYNCAGKIDIPNVLPLPQPEVLIQTRKGVAISYSFSQPVSA